VKFDCEITNAIIVDPSGRYRGTISISGEKVAGVLAEPSENAARTIDAEGLVALPGMVDQHVHFMDPGDNSREDFIHGSGAAAVGGVTTVSVKPLEAANEAFDSLQAGDVVGRVVLDVGGVS
jgi:dihydroorotase-like cyclic amidohydrolase